MQSSIDEAVEYVWPAARMENKTILVAVSGGADSVACLLSLFQRSSPTTSLCIAHFNHLLRGEESDEDERFVKRLGDKLRLRVIIGRSRAPKSEKPNTVTNNDSPPLLASSEERARQVRYQFLKEAAHRVGARYLVTAHTADDRVETILHNLCRGTGLAGLSPLPPFRELGNDLVLVRPFVNVRRHELLDYLQDIKQNYRDDSSNMSRQYTRNRIRHDVLPLIRQAISENADEAILRCAKAISEAHEFIDRQASSLLREALISALDEEVVCNAARLQDADWVVARQALQKLWRSEGWPESRLSQRHWDSLKPLLSSGGEAISRAIQFPGNLRIERDREVLRIKPM